jgi:small conductance mechanosensitive channel
MNFETILPQVTAIGVKVAGAIVLWIVGRFVLKLALKAVSASLSRSKLDPTLAQWVIAITSLMGNFLLAIAVLSVFGVETTSFAALLAAAGLAIGAAWSGLLSNFAAGVFLILFKPFKVGDEVKVADVAGRVRDIGVFATTLITGENVATTIGNSAISTAIIANYSQTDYREVEILAQLPHSANIGDIQARVEARLASLEDVRTEPAPCVAVHEINEHGPKLVVKLACRSQDIDALRYQINATILDLA